MSSCLKAAVADELISSNPCEHVSSPQLPQAERRFLTPDELAAVEAVMPPWWTLTVPFLADSGLRIGELAVLTAGAVDLLRGTVSVRRTVAEVPLAASGAKTTRTLHEAKTSSGRRVVPTLTRSTCERLSQLITERGLGAGDWLFAGRRSGAMSPHSWRDRVWRPAVKRAGLADPQPTPHALRHTAVALSKRRSEHLALLAFSGRTSVTSLARYARVSPEALAHWQDGRDPARRRR